MKLSARRNIAVTVAAMLICCLAAAEVAAREPELTATELLSRPTNSSVTVNAVANGDLEVYFEYGTTPGLYTGQTVTQLFPADDPIEVVIDNLQPDTKYYYRMRHREPGITDYSEGQEHSFRTQRPPGSAFTFTIQTDSHLFNADSSELALYQRTLLNAVADEPDFHIALGDDFEMVNVRNAAKALGRYFEQRALLGLIGHSSPIFLVLGNHEDQEGWHRDGTPTNIAIWSANARKLYYPNPIPGVFYSGNPRVEAFLDDDGLPEDYYEWVWGDAHFIVLDPFWYTATDPDVSGDNWDWTLGEDQYLWFQKTLQESTSSYIFVFSHHLTGGSNPYGRGGAEAAPYFEWGGQNEDDSWGFSFERPGWAMPIHQLMVEHGVDIFFHGHDHLFVKQDLDGIVYQEAPLPNDDSYGFGHLNHGTGYVSGDILPNSGHLRVTVSASDVNVDYIRAYLPGDGPNGEVAYSYSASSVAYATGSPPVADGKLAGEAALFTKYLGSSNIIDVTYGTFPCASSTAVILYGNIGDYSNYASSALDDAGSAGTALFNSTGMQNVWFNIIWTSEGTAGHPGYACEGAIDVERSWEAAGLAGLTDDDHSANSCE